MATSRRRSPQPPSDTQYDYLFKIILLGPSGSGKTSLLHHFLHASPLVLSSQTIGVEFATKIVTIDSSSLSTPSFTASRSAAGPSRAPRRRIKLQLWDTAGTERFRSVSRSYYRGAAGAILVYDVCSWRSFSGAGEFLRDARALGSRGLSVVVVGNKTDVANNNPSSLGTAASYYAPSSAGSFRSARSGWSGGAGAEDEYDDEEDDEDRDAGPASTHGQQQQGVEVGREVDADVARHWAAEHKVAVCVEASARSGAGVEDVFLRLARTILARIETGVVNPDDPASGIQYGDVGGWGIDTAGTYASQRGPGDGGSVRSGLDVDDAASLVGYGGQQRRRGGGGSGGFRVGEWVGGGKCC